VPHNFAAALFFARFQTGEPPVLRENQQIPLLKRHAILLLIGNADRFCVCIRRDYRPDHRLAQSVRREAKSSLRHRTHS
jgi:hypothetical protein